ncbi:MAG: virginiamycin lyase [Solirubrobacteraceae bacterium]|nr:virginiamycin lyase [Solirubrobacteraceae bacterium]
MLMRGVLICGTLAATLALAPAARADTTYVGSLGGPAVDVTAGPDGAVWHTTEAHGGRVGRTTPAGQTTEYAAAKKPGAITAGPDGALWFTDRDDAIRRVTVAGDVTTMATLQDEPLAIATGTDGNVWFAVEASKRGPIARLTPAGDLSFFSVGLPNDVGDVAGSPDGAVWFTEPDFPGTIGRIAPTGEVVRYNAGLIPGRQPTAIVAGPDGALWFTQAGTMGGIGRLTTAGDLTEYTIGLPAGSRPGDITAGPDGALWFTLKAGVGRITTGGVINVFPIAQAEPVAITGASDGAVWFADHGRPQLGRVDAPTLSPTETPDPGTTPTPTPAPTVAPEPESGETVTVEEHHGTIRVKPRGRKHFRALDAESTIPVGSIVDARHGTVSLRTAIGGGDQVGQFHGGLFKVRQAANGHTHLILRGRLDCARARTLASTSRHKRKHRRRRLWGKDSDGSFSTHGRDSVTTVRGTRWLTEDRCSGTLTKVTAGHVVVRDRASGKRYVVRSGARHFAPHRS